MFICGMGEKGAARALFLPDEDDGGQGHGVPTGDGCVHRADKIYNDNFLCSRKKSQTNLRARTLIYEYTSDESKNSHHFVRKRRELSEGGLAASFVKVCDCYFQFLVYCQVLMPAWLAGKHNCEISRGTHRDNGHKRWLGRRCYDPGHCGVLQRAAWYYTNKPIYSKSTSPQRC